MRDLEDKIFKEVLTRLSKKKCSCGCNRKCSNAPKINVDKQYDAPISENLRHYIANNIPLTTIINTSVKSVVDLVIEVRSLWKKNVIILTGKDKKLFETTDIGTLGMFGGKMVPLDFPLLENKDRIPGGLAKGMSVEDLAKRHKVGVEEIEKALRKGVKVESEHTSDEKIAREIAMDHVYEDLKYYDKLKKAHIKEQSYIIYRRNNITKKIIQEAVTKSTVYKFKGILSVDITKRNKEEVISDIRSLTGITIVSTKPAEGENITPKTDESILKIKVDPHPFIGKGGFNKDSVEDVIADIRKIDGVKYFKQIGTTELVGL
jgi:hypothetical protein